VNREASKKFIGTSTSLLNNDNNYCPERINSNSKSPKMSIQNSPINQNASIIKPYIDSVNTINKINDSKYQVLLKQNRTILNAYTHFQKMKIDETDYQD